MSEKSRWPLPFVTLSLWQNEKKGKEHSRARARARKRASKHRAKPRKKLSEIRRANPRGHNFPREFHFADIGGYTRGYPLASFAGNKRQFAQIAEFLILI